MDPVDQIAVAPETPNQDPPQIDVGGGGPIVVTPSEAVAANRANKYTIGFPKSPVNNPTALDMMLQGREEDLRKQAASIKDFDNVVKQQQAVVEIAKKQGPLSLPQSMAIKEIISRKQADPNTVIEENFAEEYMNTLKQTAIANPDSELAAAMREIPGHVVRQLDAGTDFKTKKEILNTLAEKASDAYEKQSWAGWGVDMLKGTTAAYGEFKLRGQVPGTGFWDGPLASNMEKQWSALMALPMDEFKIKAPAIVDKLIQDNPSMAVLWTSAGQGMSNEDKFLVNFFPLLDLTLVGDATKLGAGVVRRVALGNAVNRVIKEIVKDGEEVVSKASIKEAIGDIKGAAVEQFATEQVERSPTSTGKVTPVMENLSSLMRSEHLAIGADAVGAMGPVRPFRAAIVDQMREVQNLIFGNFNDAVQKMMKVEQLPAVLAISRVATKLAASMEGEFRGLVNTVLDTNLVRDTATGQWFAKHTITRSGGKLFNSVKEVQDYARSLGLGEVEAVEAQGPSRPRAVLSEREPRNPIVDKGAPRLERDIKDVFVGELDDAELRAATTGKDTYRKGVLYKDIGHTMDVDDRLDTLSKYHKIEVPQKGLGYYMVKTKPVPINSDFARDLMIVTSEQQTPNKLLNGFSAVLGSARTPEETMALPNVINRKVATYGNALLTNVFKDLHQEIKELKGWPLPFSSRKEKWDQWKDAMSWMENERNPETGAKGVIEAFSTPGELRDKYVQRLRRAPDDQEIKAAFAYRTQLVLSEQLKKLTKFKDQIREGGQRWTIEGLDKSFETKVQTGTIPKASFNGVAEKVIPNSDTATVLVMRREADNVAPLVSSSFLRRASSIPVEIHREIEAGTLKVVRLLEPDENPLLGMYDATAHGNIRITHVVTSNASDAALGLDHIKINRATNHDYDHYVIQPRIKHNPFTGAYEYLGDHTVAGFNIRAMGAQVAEHLDKVRQLLKAGNEDAARTYHANSTLPMSWEEVKGWFTPEMSGEVLGGRLSLDHRIHVVPTGKLSNEVDKNLERSFLDAGHKFVDRTRESYGQLGLRDPYEGFHYMDNGVNREGMSLRNTGTRDNPLWAVAPTKFIDPVTSINRSLVKVINDVHLNDYKATSIEHWIQEAKDLLDVKDSALRAAPAYYFHNAENFWLKGLAGKDALRANNLMTSQMQIKQFLGVTDANTAFLHNTAQILADSIYTKFGEKPYMLAMADKLPLLRDPFRFIRSITFNAKLGLFAVGQIFVQMQAFASIHGIAGPVAASQGTGAFLLHTWSRINRNPEIMEALDKYASKIGFKPGQFREAHELLTSTGFEHVAGEHAAIDSTTYKDLIGGAIETFLHLGQSPFREGERASRTAAYYTAYLEFRKANPLRAVTEVDARNILNRADMFTSNMSRASSSAVQKGIWSLPTQFVSYTLRQAELMMGKRLTDIEKARLFGTYAMLYGVPAAAGSFTLGVGGDLMNSDMVKSGYVSTSDENWKINTIATEGLPAFLGKVMTGNLYNIGQRYAGGGGPVVDLLRSDKSIWEIMGGASGSTLYNSVLGLDGLYTAAKAAIKGTGPFTVKPEDFVDPFKQVTSFNAAWKVYAAVNTGKWLSSKEMEIGDASPLNALFMAATGLNYQEASEVGTIAHEKKVEEEAQAYGLQKFSQEWRRGIREFDKNNPEQGHDYWKRAFTYLRITGYPEEKWPSAIAIATEGDESMVQRIKLDYYLKNVPENRKDIGWEAMQKYMKSQGNK